MSTHRGEKLADLIRDAGLDQKTVADRVDVSPQAVSSWVTERSTPGLARILKLDQLLGNDGRVLAIYGKPASHTLEEVVEAAMQAATTQVTDALERLQTTVNDEVRSQLVEHDDRLLDHEGRLRELALEVRAVALRVFGDPEELADPEAV